MPRKKIILIDSSRARQNFELVGISKVGLLTVEPYDVNEIDR